MRLRRPGRVLIVSLLLAPGCAHHGKNQYAFAPPYAPPVYPQPASFSQPPTPTMPAAAAPVAAGVPPAPGMMPAPCPPPGVPVSPAAGQTTPCPPGEYIVGGTVMSAEVPCTGTGEVVVADGQTPPCPPGP